MICYEYIPVKHACVLCFKEKRKKISKESIMWIIYVLIIFEIGNAQLPEDMYVTQDEELVKDLLKQHSFEEKIINNTEERRVSMEDLMLHPYDLENEKHYYLRDFGHIGTPVQTFTQVLTTQGRYYQSPEEYDENCACPPVYQVIWNPSRGRHKILAAQLRQGFVPQETTQIRVEERQMYIVFYENHNQVIYRTSNIMTVVGKEDPRITHQRITNFRQRFLYGMRRHSPRLAIGYKALAQHSWQSMIKRAVANYTDSQGHVRIYRYLQLTDLDVRTQLKMIDHMTTILYETYEWVEWKVTAIDANGVDPVWRRIERQEPCQISMEESWGIKYVPGTRGTLRVCDVREYSYMLNASDHGFDIIMPIGSFEPANLSQDFRYDLRELKEVVQWKFVESAVGRDAMLKVEFTHGPKRRRPTQIYSLVTNTIHSRFHKNFLWSGWWELDRTKLMIGKQDEMCERTEYTNFINRLGENQRPTTATDHYRTLKKMHAKYPQECQSVYTNDARCRKPRGEGQCRYAVGQDITAYLRSEIRVDPWANQSVIPQGEICFNKTISSNDLIKEEIPSTAFEIIGIRGNSEIKRVMKQNLKTFTQKLDDQGQNQANEMNRVLASVEDVISQMRGQALERSHQKNLRARYAAKRAVASNGADGINWNKKFIKTKKSIVDTLVKGRELELELSNVIEDAKRKIIAYYLYQRIRLKLPHVGKVTQLKNLYKYRIGLRRGYIYWQPISNFQKITQNQETNHNQSQQKPTTATTHQTITSPTKQGENRIYPQKKEKGGDQKDEFIKIKQLIEDELAEHQGIPNHDKNKSEQTKDEKEGQVETLLIILAGIAGVVGTISIISLTWYLANRDKERQLVKISEAKKLINKAKSIPFTGNQ